MKTRTSKNHVDNQRELFNKEFSQISTSDLAEWQKSYLDRINKHLLKKTTSGEIIELGCGDGKLSLSLAEKGYNVTVCDISDKAISLVKKFAKEKSVKIKTVQCDVTKLPFQNNTFDFGIANAILEHLENEKLALSEWSRVLKPKGRLLIVTPLRQRHVLPIWWIVNWFHDRRLGHVRRYDRKRYQKFLKHRLILQTVLYTGHTPKVCLTILNMFFKNKSIEKLAEQTDMSLKDFQYDGNNIIGFFQKK